MVAPLSTNPPIARPVYPQETLALLEGIELHADEWSRVAEHVNTAAHAGQAVRSHDECIMAFLRSVLCCEDGGGCTRSFRASVVRMAVVHVGELWGGGTVSTNCCLDISQGRVTASLYIYFYVYIYGCAYARV